MKTKLITLLILAIFTSTYAQFGPEQIITTNADEARSVYSADLDGDGDMDVLSTSYEGISWYENDGDGDFGSQQIITINADTFIYSVYATDLDGDGDMDVLSGVSGDDIFWYENVNGDGSVWIEHVILNIFCWASKTYAADLDSDGDKDIIYICNQSPGTGNGVIRWLENDGVGNFGTEHNIGYSGFQIYATDIDGDGDMDVLTNMTEYDYNKRIIWYENDGYGNFGSEQIIISNADAFISSVYATDLDGDGDMDVLSASGDDNKIAWYENVNGDGSVWIEHIITTDALEARSVYATDIDNDGNMDVLSASYDDNKIAWYDNINGLGDFGPQQIITTDANGAESVYAEDLNGDGYMDVLSASSGDDKIAWYENTHIFGVNENVLIDISFFPNPVKNVLNIQSNTTITEIEIYNQLGQLVMSNSNQNTIDLSSVSSGIYFIKIKDENGNIGNKKVVKQ